MSSCTQLWTSERTDRFQIPIHLASHVAVRLVDIILTKTERLLSDRQIETTRIARAGRSKEIGPIIQEE